MTELNRDVQEATLFPKQPIHLGEGGFSKPADTGDDDWQARLPEHWMELPQLALPANGIVGHVELRQGELAFDDFYVLVVHVCRGVITDDSNVTFSRGNYQVLSALYMTTQILHTAGSLHRRHAQ